MVNFKLPKWSHWTQSCDETLSGWHIIIKNFHLCVMCHCVDFDSWQSGKVAEVDHELIVWDLLDSLKGFGLS